jgi:hypothetical protein
LNNNASPGAILARRKTKSSLASNSSGLESVQPLLSTTKLKGKKNDEYDW